MNNPENSALWYMTQLFSWCSNMTDKTLREYLEFLKEKGFITEASFYSNEVVTIVSMSTGLTLNQVLDLPTKKVIEALVRLQDQLQAMKSPKKYDVELKV